MYVEHQVYDSLFLHSRGPTRPGQGRPVQLTVLSTAWPAGKKFAGVK
jgi:hypothetical protein